MGWAKLSDSLSWSPGHIGKGYLLHNGTLKTWVVDPYEPLDQREVHQRNHELSPIALNFEIDPDGGIVTASPTTKVESIITADPRLYDAGQRPVFEDSFDLDHFEPKEDKAGHPDFNFIMSRTATDQASDSLHVALSVPPNIAKKLRQWADDQKWPEGTKLEPADEYHVTLLYSSRGYEEHHDADWLEHVSGYEVEITGLDEFGEDEDELATVLRLESPGVKNRADDLQSVAEDEGLEISRFPGGYKPHITVAYGPGKPKRCAAPKLKFRTGPSSVSTPRESSWHFADWNGYTNWDTMNAALTMNSDYDLNTAARQVIEDGATPEQFHNWLIEAVIGPFNQQQIRDSQEWNAIDPDERRRLVEERGGFMEDDPGADDTPDLIDPELVNVQEIYQEILDEFEENAQYERDEADRQLRQMQTGLDFGNGNDENEDRMLDAMYNYHGAKPEHWFEERGMSKHDDPRWSHNTVVRLPWEQVQQLPRYPDEFIEPSTRVKVWGHHRQQGMQPYLDQLRDKYREYDFSDERLQEMAENLYRHNHGPNADDRQIDMSDPRMQEIIYSDPRIQEYQQKGYPQYLPEFTRDVIHAIQSGQQHPGIPLMQQALEQRGYTPEQIQQYMQQKRSWDPEAKAWTTLEQAPPTQEWADAIERRRREQQYLDSPSDFYLPEGPPSTWTSKTGAVWEDIPAPMTPIRTRPTGPPAPPRDDMEAVWQAIGQAMEEGDVETARWLYQFLPEEVRPRNQAPVNKVADASHILAPASELQEWLADLGGAEPDAPSIHHDSPEDMVSSPPVSPSEALKYYPPAHVPKEMKQAMWRNDEEAGPGAPEPLLAPGSQVRFHAPIWTNDSGNPIRNQQGNTLADPNHGEVGTYRGADRDSPGWHFCDFPLSLMNYVHEDNLRPKEGEADSTWNEFWRGSTHASVKTADSPVSPSEAVPKEVKQSGMTLPQELRHWEMVGAIGDRVGELPNGYTVERHTDPNTIHGVGQFLHNCWQEKDPHRIADEASKGFIPHTLHDEHGLPRAAFYVSTNPGVMRDGTPTLTEVLGRGTDDLKHPHIQPLPDWAEQQGYHIKGWDPQAWAEDQGYPDDYDYDEGAVRTAATKTADSPLVTSWHLTDNPQFALDPTYVPEDNALAIAQRNDPGLYVGDPEHWLNGFDYVRPFAAEIEHPPSERGRWGRETFIPADMFPQARVKRVIPVDEYARETYGSPGWIEGALDYAGVSYPDQPKFSNYRYTGPDVRDMSPDETARHQERVDEYIKRVRPHILDRWDEDGERVPYGDPRWERYSHINVAGTTRTKLLEMAQQLPDDQASVVHRFPDGWTIRELQTYGDMHREGTLMDNCWKRPTKANDPRDPNWDYHNRDDYGDVRQPTDPDYFVPGDSDWLPEGDEDRYLSLRDPDNLPHLSFHHDWERSTLGNVLGRHNSEPSYPYVQRLQAWREASGEPLDYYQDWGEDLGMHPQWPHTPIDDWFQHHYDWTHRTGPFEYMQSSRRIADSPITQADATNDPLGKNPAIIPSRQGDPDYLKASICPNCYQVHRPDEPCPDSAVTQYKQMERQWYKRDNNALHGAPSGLDNQQMDLDKSAAFWEAHPEDEAHVPAEPGNPWGADPSFNPTGYFEMDCPTCHRYVPGRVPDDDPSNPLGWKLCPECGMYGTEELQLNGPVKGGDAVYLPKELKSEWMTLRPSGEHEMGTKRQGSGQLRADMWDDTGEDGDGSIWCDQGHEHWGRFGAAGALLRHVDPQGQARYLMTLRSPAVFEGNTWGIPGGAMNRSEQPHEAALRETGEELGALPEVANPRVIHTNDHGGWQYHTVAGDVDEPFTPDVSGWETSEAGWYTPEQIDQMNLHPGFAQTWAQLRGPERQGSAESRPDDPLGDWGTDGGPEPGA